MIEMVKWFGSRPVAAFYVLCYAISFGLWLPLITIRMEILQLLLVVGLFGPALACIWVAKGLPAQTETTRPRRPQIPFLICWAVSALTLMAYSPAARSGNLIPAIFISAVLALVPAFVVSSAFSGPPGVRSTLKSLIHPSGWWGWYLLAVLLPPASRLFGSLLSETMGWVQLTHPTLTSDLGGMMGAIAIPFLYNFIYAGGLNEEVGWTGLALPRLQALHSPLIASMVIWSLWILWHVPLHLAGLYELNLHVLIGTFFARFIFTWLYIRSSGGMLTALLFHASANAASQLIPITYASLWVEGVLAVAIIIGARMWRKLPGNDATIQAHKGMAG